MKKIGKESNGSELFTVIEPGLPSNRLSEMEKSLILGGECDVESCSVYRLCNGDACNCDGPYYDDGDLCGGYVCPVEICIVEFDPCMEETIVPSWPIDDFGSGYSGSDCSGSDCFGEYSFCFELN